MAGRAGPAAPHVSKVLEDGGLEIGPLGNLPVIKDLATDMSGFFEKWQEAKGAFVPTKTRHDDIEAIAPASAPRLAANAAIECINCGVCHAACDTVRWNESYLGPAALNRAWTLVNDVRDGAGEARLAAVAGDSGCQCCHTHMSCTSFCPKAIAPTYSIAGLKRAVMWHALKGGRR